MTEYYSVKEVNDMRKSAQDISATSLACMLMDGWDDIPWHEMAWEILNLISEDHTPNEWVAMSDMFYAFVGVSLEDAIRYLA